MARRVKTAAECGYSLLLYVL